MATIKDVAKKAGVSPTTVSRVINNSGYVSRKIRQKVLRAMEDLNYYPNALARSLVTNKVRTIGLVVPSVETPFFAAVIRGVEEVTREAGYGLLFTHSGDNLQEEEACLKLLLENRVAGVLIVPASQQADHLLAVRDQGIPLVVMARKVPGLPALAVVVDNEEGSYRAVRHLLELGHSMVGIINGRLDTSTGVERWQGVNRALEEKGLTLPPDMVVEGDFSWESGYRLTKELWQRSGGKMTALYAANDMMAVGALLALRELKLKVPQDVSVVAFETLDGTGFAGLVHPALAGNIHPSRSMGKIAAELMLQEIEEYRKERNLWKEVCLQLEFVVGETCGPPKP